MDGFDGIRSKFDGISELILTWAGLCFNRGDGVNIRWRFAVTVQGTLVLPESKRLRFELIKKKKKKRPKSS